MRLIKKAIAIIMVLAVFLTPVIANADETEENHKTKILFLGNSLFYYNTMSGDKGISEDKGVFYNFCKAAGKNVEVTSITESGTTLYRMASDKTSIGKSVLSALENNVYDYVILNPSRRVTPFEYSVYHAEKQAALTLNSLINAMGAKTLLAAQPGVAVENIPVYTMNENEISSTTTYTLPMDRYTNMVYVENLCYDLCKDMVNAEVVRVGEAAETIISTFPDYNSLYNTDNRHPSTRGSYLQAACYYSAIFKESPVGVNYVYSLYPVNAITAQRAAAVAVLNQNKSILKTEFANRVLSANLISNSAVHLKWTEPKTAEYYNVYKKVGSESYKFIGRTVGKECSFNDSGLKGGNTYYYKIAPVHKVGNVTFESDFSNVASVRVLNKVKISSVKLTSGKTAVVSYKKVDGAVKYRIYRKLSTAKTYKHIATTKNLKYTDKKLILGKTYDYMVIAQGANNNVLSENSNVKSVLSIANPKVRINAGYKKATLKISPVKHAQKYAIYIKKSGNKSYKLLKTTSKLTVTIKNLKSNTKYYFKVKAYKGKLQTNTSSVGFICWAKIH